MRTSKTILANNNESARSPLETGHNESAQASLATGSNESPLKIGEKKDRRTVVQEVVIVVMLSATALLTAWAAWIGSLHVGTQAITSARANSLAIEASSAYNEGLQSLMRDMLICDNINELTIDLAFAEAKDDSLEIERLRWKIEEFEKGMNTHLKDAYSSMKEKAPDHDSFFNPFSEEAFVALYFEQHDSLQAQSQQKQLESQNGGSTAGRFGLISVGYSVILFLLGIANFFKNKKAEWGIIVISCIAFTVTTIYLLTLPLPAGFNLFNYLGPSR